MAEFTNQATLRYNNTVTNSNIVVGNLVQALDITKTAVREEYSTDENTTYVIGITNNSETAYTGLTLTDNLGAYQYNEQTRLIPLTYIEGSMRYYVNGALQPALTVTAGNDITITGINVPAGGNAILIYETRPNIYAPLDAGAVVTNTASLTGPGVAETLTAEETVTTRTGAQLSISKAINPSTVSANGQVTYTFVIQNTGNSAADGALGAIVEDIFTPVLNGLTAAYNGTPLTLSRDYTYNAETGAFATTAGTITVPAAEYSRNEANGAVEITPSVGILTVTGTI